MSDENTALINGAAQLISTGVNYASAANTNKKQRKWAEEQYTKQNNDSINFWKMQNAYNDPSSQMQRLKDGGLNPNLVYGNGAAAQTAGPIATHSAPAWNPKAPQIEMQGVSNSLSQYYDIQQRKANIALTESQTRATDIKANNDAFISQYTNTDAYGQALSSTSPDNLNVLNSFLKGRNDLQSTENMMKTAEYENYRKLPIVQQATEQLRIAKSQGDLNQVNVISKKLENDLNKMGVQKSDSLIERIISRTLSDAFGIRTLGDGIDKTKNFINKYK